MIRDAKTSDIESIREIYNHYILNSVFTYEYDPISHQEMKSRFESIYLTHPFIVYEENNKILGYGYLTEFKPRKGYMYTKEVSIYLDQNFMNKGIGTKIYMKLLEKAKEKGYKELMFSIDSTNTSSIEFFKKFGGKQVGFYQNIGYKFNQTLSIIILQISINSKL